jgi:hypothetical protein
MTHRMQKLSKKNTDLFKQLLGVDSEDETDNDADNCYMNSSGQHTCLITMCPLIENYVTLECGHSFNYDALFKDIYNHKKKFLTLESTRLSPLEIRCPYCRNIQKKLLPIKAGTPLVYGVNSSNDSIDKIHRRMKNVGEYYKIFHTYMNGMCCHGMNHDIPFSETDVICQSPKVMFNNLNHLVYCPEHFISTTKDIFTIEMKRLTKLVQMHKLAIETIKGAKKQAIVRKIKCLTIIRENMEEEIIKQTETHKEKEKSINKTKENDNKYNEWETAFDSTDKYSKKCRCFAYYTSGKKKDTRCENVSFNGQLYCNKHPMVYENYTK